MLNCINQGNKIKTKMIPFSTLVDWRKLGTLIIPLILLEFIDQQVFFVYGDIIVTTTLENSWLLNFIKWKIVSLWHSIFILAYVQRDIHKCSKQCCLWQQILLTAQTLIIRRMNKYILIYSHNVYYSVMKMNKHSGIQ